MKDKTRLKRDRIYVSILNDTRDPIIFSFASNKKVGL